MHSKDRHGNISVTACAALKNISVTAWNALYGVFLIGGMLGYRQKKNRPVKGGLSYFVSLRISARTANGKARISSSIIRYHPPE